MKTKPTTTTTFILSVVIFLFGLIFAAPRAQAQGGVPLWTNRYSDAATGSADARAVAVDDSGNVFVRGFDCTIERDGGHGYFIRFNGRAGFAYRLQRAASVTGPWSDLATNTVSASGFVEYHEMNLPVGAGFFRTLQP
jgi:hypothetical protein